MQERTNKITETAAPQFGASPARARTGDDIRLQVDIGNYKLMVEDVHCGELWVEKDPSCPDEQTRTVEHWMLYSSYVTPSSEHRDARVQLIYQDGRYKNLADFISTNRENPTTTYIRAVCAVL